MFAPGTRLIPTVPNRNGGFQSEVSSVVDYVLHGDLNFHKNGFFEHEVARRTERYGKTAQVFSIYELRHGAADAKPFERGINSFQLMTDGHRWWIVTIYWQDETADSPIPQGYLEGIN